MTALDSANDLSGVDLGGGNVHLKWSYSVNIVSQHIVFDVYGGSDPTDGLRSRFAMGVAERDVDLQGSGFSGDCYFTVVARRDDRLSLPAKLLALAVRPPTISRALSAAVGAAGGPVASSGLGFPFGITANGAVFSQGGDPLLHSKSCNCCSRYPANASTPPTTAPACSTLCSTPTPTYWPPPLSFSRHPRPPQQVRLHHHPRRQSGP